MASSCSSGDDGGVGHVPPINPPISIPQNKDQLLHQTGNIFNYFNTSEFNREVLQQMFAPIFLAAPDLKNLPQVSRPFQNLYILICQELNIEPVKTDSALQNIKSLLDAPEISESTSALMQPASQAAAKEALESNERILSVAKAAFFSEIKNETSQLSFLVYLKGIHPFFSNDLYHKYIVILQSSGAGKTRLISGFAKQHKMHLVYACYRKPGTTGFPLSVNSFHDCLIQIFKSSEDKEKTVDPILVCKSLLLHVIQLVLVDKTSKFQNGISEKSEIYEDLWQTAFENAQSSAFTVPESLGVKRASKADPDNPFRFFLVFDEASWMLQHKVLIKPAFWYSDGLDSEPKVKVTLFRVLRRAFKEMSDVLVKFGVLPIFIDTNSAVSNFAPSTVNDPSNRGSDLLKIIPPFFQTNAVPTAYDRDSPFLFGRPLWGAMYSQFKQRLGVQSAQNDTITLASQKWHHESDEFGVWSASVFSCLLDLDINAGARLPEHMMRSFMATCLNISVDRTRTLVHYPIEPVLARGALNTLLEFQSQQETLAESLQHLQMLRRHAEIGSRGEMVAQLFCLLLQPRSMEFDAAYPLKCFLGRLLLNEEEDIGVGSIVDEVFGDATINLCQFHWFEKYPQSAADFKTLHELGIGAALPTNAPGVDLVVPVKLSGNRGYTAMLLQIKNLDARPSQRECQDLLDLMGSTRIFGYTTHAAFQATSDCRTNGQVKSASDKPSTTAAAPAAASTAAPAAAPVVQSSSKSALKNRLSLEQAKPLSSKTATRTTGDMSKYALYGNPPKEGRTTASVAAIAAAPAAPSNKLRIPKNAKSFPVCKLLFLVRNPPTADRQNYLSKCEFNPSNPNGPQSVEGVLYGIPSFFSDPALVDIFNVLVDDLHKRRLDDVEETTESDVGRGDKVQFANSLLYNAAKFPFLKGSELKVKPFKQPPKK